MTLIACTFLHEIVFCWPTRSRSHPEAAKWHFIISIGLHCCPSTNSWTSHHSPSSSLADQFSSYLDSRPSPSDCSSSSLSGQSLLDPNLLRIQAQFRPSNHAAEALSMLHAFTSVTRSVVLCVRVREASVCWAELTPAGTDSSLTVVQHCRLQQICRKVESGCGRQRSSAASTNPGSGSNATGILRWSTTWCNDEKPVKVVDVVGRWRKKANVQWSRQQRRCGTISRRTKKNPVDIWRSTKKWSRYRDTMMMLCNVVYCVLSIWILACLTYLLTCF